jgi:hypothetical protein
MPLINQRRTNTPAPNDAPDAGRKTHPDLNAGYASGTTDTTHE